MKRFFRFGLFLLLFILVGVTSNKIIAPERVYNLEVFYDETDIGNNSSAIPTKDNLPIFTAEDIPDDIYQRMLGKSIPLKYKTNVDISSLSYLHVSYFGFDNEFHVGEMIVNKKLAEDVISIFRELYIIRYPIEKIRLIDEYDANDELSMQDNNTSCFCYRVIAGSNTISNHARGTAIDINPLYNPYVSGDIVSPISGRRYVNRLGELNHMINTDTEIYKIFISHGWSWGRRLVKAKRLPTF